MRKNALKRGLAVLAAALLTTATAVPALAENTFTYTPLTVSSTSANYSTTLEKDLTMPNDANVPNATFDFTASSANVTEIAATETTLAVKKGPGTPTISSVTFSPSDTTTAGAAGDGITNDAIKKYATKIATIDLSGVTFTEPGVYRYIITESGAATNQGITNDSELTKTLDVYVENVDGTPAVTEAWIYNGTEYTSEADAQAAADSDQGAESGEGDYSGITHREAQAATTTPHLEIAGYVIYDGTITTAPNKVASNAGETPNGAEPSGATKDDKYINEYDTVNLTFSKTVTGNQGSRDQYFAFTVTISGASAGTKYTVDLSQADATPHASDATTIADITSKTNPAELTVGADGTVSQVFYLHHGQSITIKGLAVGTGYTVSEAQENYTPSLALTGDTKTGATGSETDIETGSGKTSATDTNITADTTVALTNNLEGTIPTGVLLSATVGIGIIVVALIGIALYFRKKRLA